MMSTCVAKSTVHHTFRNSFIDEGGTGVGATDRGLTTASVALAEGDLVRLAAVAIAGDAMQKTLQGLRTLSQPTKVHFGCPCIQHVMIAFLLICTLPFC